MKNTMRKLAAVLVCAGMLGNTSVTATGIPVFDGAAMTNAFQQLMNWQAQLSALTRGGLDKLKGADTNVRESSQVKRMFERRKKKCRAIQRDNPASGTICLKITELEQNKYDLLIEIDDDLKKDFDRINGLVKSQGKSANSMAAATPLSKDTKGFNYSNQAGKAETAENNVQIQVNALIAKYNQYKNKIEFLDSQIAQYNSMRKMLTKEQLTGSSLNKNITKGVTYGKLTIATDHFRQKAKDVVKDRQEIESKTKPIYKPN